MEREEGNREDERVKKAVEDALGGMTDPGSGAKLMDLGLVRNLAVEDGVVSLTFRPSSTVCPAAFTLAPGIKSMVKQVEGVKCVNMNVENFNRAEELMTLLQDE